MPGATTVSAHDNLSEKENKKATLNEQKEKFLSLERSMQEDIDELQKHLDTLLVTQSEKQAVLDGLKEEHDSAVRLLQSKEQVHHKLEREKEDIDSKLEAYYQYKPTLDNALKQLLSVSDADGDTDYLDELTEEDCGGVNWYAPNGLNTSSLLDCFNREELGFAERASLLDKCNDSQKYHDSGWLAKKGIDAKYYNEKTLSSPRLIWYQLVSQKLNEINLFLETYQDYESSGDDTAYKTLVSNLTAAEREFNEAKESTAAMREQYQAAQTALTQAEEAVNKQQSLLKEKQEAQDLITAKKLISQQALQYHDCFYDAGVTFNEVETYIKGIKDDDDLSLLDLAALVGQFDELEAMMQKLASVRQAYADKKLKEKSDAYYDNHALDALEALERAHKEGEQSSVESVDDEDDKFEYVLLPFSKTVAMHDANFLSLDKYEEQLKVLEGRLLEKINSKKQAVLESKEQAISKRKELADRYLPQKVRLESRTYDDTNALGRLDSYINQRNQTYANWDMFTGFFNWLFNRVRSIPYCLHAEKHKTEKEKRQDYVNELKESVVSWRDEGNSHNLSQLLAQKGSFKPRRNPTDKKETLKGNLEALAEDVQTVDGLMPQQEELVLADREYNAFK